MTGSEFAERIKTLRGAQREDAILQAAEAGHVPPALLHSWKPVSVNTSGHRIVYNVAPDYFAIGTDADFLRTPMWPATAQRIADLFHCILPTPQMVDQIWRAASTRLPFDVPPAARPPTPAMESVNAWTEHNRQVDVRLVGKPLGSELVAGHKKDIVISPTLRGDRVAIYGAHQLDGTPIQPFSTVHAATYSDYSHGVRLISVDCLVDDARVDIRTVFNDPMLAFALSASGAFLPRFPDVAVERSFVKATLISAVPAPAASPAPQEPGVNRMGHAASVLAISGFLTFVQAVRLGART